MPDQSLPERWLDTLRNNRFLAVFVVVGAITGGLAAFTSSVSTISEFVTKFFVHPTQPPNPPNPLYLVLRDDLRNLDRTVGNLATAKNTTLASDMNVVADDAHQIADSSRPVCEAKDKVSALGDQDIRQDLDVICDNVELIARFVRERRPKDAVDVAALLRDHGAIQKAHDRVEAHI